MATTKFKIGIDGKIRKVAYDLEEGWIYVECYAKDFHRLDHKDMDSKIFILDSPTAEELIKEIEEEENGN